MADFIDPTIPPPVPDRSLDQPYIPLYTPNCVMQLGNAFVTFGNTMASMIGPLQSAALGISWQSYSTPAYRDVIDQLATNVLLPAANSAWKTGEILQYYAQEVITI